MRAISSRVLARAATDSVAEVCRRSWKRSPFRPTAQPLQADRSEGRAPHPPLEIAAAQQPTLNGGEHQPLGAGLAVGGQVPGQSLGRHSWEGHGAPTGLGRGGS
jgi:hypothetical protein